MNLENEVLFVMNESESWLTVEDVTQRVAERIKKEITAILNAFVDDGELTSVHGGGGYSTRYGRLPLVRRA